MRFSCLMSSAKPFEQRCSENDDLFIQECRFTDAIDSCLGPPRFQAKPPAPSEPIACNVAAASPDRRRPDTRGNAFGAGYEAYWDFDEIKPCMARPDQHFN